MSAPTPTESSDNSLVNELRRLEIGKKTDATVASAAAAAADADADATVAPAPMRATHSTVKEDDQVTWTTTGKKGSKTFTATVSAKSKAKITLTAVTRYENGVKTVLPEGSTYAFAAFDALGASLL